MKKRDSLQKVYRYFGSFKQNNAKKYIFYRKMDAQSLGFRWYLLVFLFEKFNFLIFTGIKIHFE